jgi:hypothetical protein
MGFIDVKSYEDGLFSIAAEPGLLFYLVIIAALHISCQRPGISLYRILLTSSDQTPRSDVLRGEKVVISLNLTQIKATYAPFSFADDITCDRFLSRYGRWRRPLSS